MASTVEIDNTIYDNYGDRWYTADDDPVALLRSENKVKTPWIIERLPRYVEILDVGCGAGFLTNELSAASFEVTGVDLSQDSLAVARRFDKTGKVKYIQADAFKLPFPDESFEVVCSLDFLEHIDDPASAIKEMSRVLKPNGQFFFHTFNRNFLAWLVVIKLVEWLIPKTPKNMHILKYFIKPFELKRYCQRAGMKVHEMTGIRPVLSSIPMTELFSGKVPAGMRFELTSGLSISYMGMARKNSELR